jgi:hypothetical protein
MRAAVADLCRPAYLQVNAAPRRPDDLPAHQWLAFARDEPALRLDLLGPGGERCTVRVEPRIASNNQYSIQQMCPASASRCWAAATCSRS